MTGLRGIDHLVLPVHDLDAARRTYEGLGFTLTPTAQHPFGTDNSLVQMQDCFLELVTVGRPEDIPEPTATGFSFAAFNRDFLKAREGFSMLVFESRDSQADREAFLAAGLHAWDHVTFEREARLPDGSEVTVGFSLAFVTDDGMPEAAFFTCQQRAPEHFWKPEYQNHTNGARAVREVVMTSYEPDRAVPFFRGLQGEDAVSQTPSGIVVETPRGRISVMTPDALRGRFGVLPPGDATCAHFVGYLLDVLDIERTEYVLREADIPITSTDEGLLIAPNQAFGCLVGFVQEGAPGAIDAR